MKALVLRLRPLWALVLTMLVVPPGADAQDTLPRYLKDRGTGVASSVFGTYIEPRQVVLYPFFEYSYDHDREYSPAELGYGLAHDYLGKFHGYNAQLLLAYGVNDWLALELEAAWLHAELEKSPQDTSATPAKITESAVGDLEGNVRIRLKTEGEKRPEIFSWLELTARTNPDKKLIAEPYWDVRPGIGFVKGFGFGTLSIKVAGEYNREESHPILGEVTIEYLKRLSPAWRLFVAIEGGEGGAPDEFEFITGVRWRISNSVAFKFDNSVGLSPKATDWAPQAGLMILFP